jgi:hypothetical protein
MIVRNGGPCRLPVVLLLAAMFATRLWNPDALRALRFAVLGRMGAWLPAPIHPSWAEAALRECRSFRIEALGTLYGLFLARIVTAREIAPPPGWEGATIGTLEEIDAVTKVTPGGPPPRHSGERDEGA